VIHTEFDLAQADMRRAFAGGAVGVFASACVWIASAIVSVAATPRLAVLSLLLGGMFIHPLAIGLARLLGRSGAIAKGNPLARLALEGTVWMLLAIPLAFALSLQRTEWFFIAMMLTIGGRYLTFATLYGMRIYWACGAVLAAAAVALATSRADSTVAAFAGGLIELIFAAIIYCRCRVEEADVSQSPA
jgi:hypothetical protein